VTTQFDGPVHAATGTVLTLGESCRLGRGAYFETEESGSIRVGSHVRINAGCVIVSHAAITIGSDCLIGEYVSIRDADHGVDPGSAIRSQPHRSDPIRIGDNVWIGRGAVILRGLTIGSGAVIGANSVVTRDVPPMGIVVGAPARLLRMRDASPAALSPEPAHG
jgi:acetyltransferase-like isoleucine patch superfamily enzyme